MPPIVADTTPLNYLVLIESVEVLPRLYGRVLIPPSVLAELADPYAPVQVRTWATQSRDWLSVVPLRAPADSSLMHLDAGERDAIALSSEQHASLILMDERDGAAAARARNLKVVGTLGVLDIAAGRGWIDLPATMLEQDALRKKRPKGD